MPTMRTFEGSISRLVAELSVGRSRTLSDKKTSLDGPTTMAPIIMEASQKAAELKKISSDVLSYLVLLIITDGDIDDLDDSIDAIVTASALPLSIIFIGVGQADFGAMEILDGDDGLLQSTTGRKSLRDIVQFVPYRRFASSPEDLAAEVLQEIPRQFMDYVKAEKIPVPPASSADLVSVARGKREKIQRDLAACYGSTSATWNVQRNDS